MPTLRNTRHEKFALELAAGKSATEAYVLAGYRSSRRNASRLRTSEGVIGRVKELQAASANHAVISVATICAELDAAIQIAIQGKQAAAMVAASTLRAKLAGLLTDRVEIRQADPFASCESMEEIADTIAREGGVELSAEELVAFTKLVTEWHDAMKHFLASCKAQPVQPAMSQSQQLDHERKRLGLRRIGNGCQR